jgi:hypothetical protein
MRARPFADILRRGVAVPLYTPAKAASAADETGVKVFYEVSLDAATRTEEFNIVGGWSESSYLEHLAEKQSETIL